MPWLNVNTSVLSLSSLVVCCLVLSSRYDTTASLERPIHLSIITLLFSGLVFAIRSKWTQPGIGYHPLTVFDDISATKTLWKGWSSLVLSIWRKALAVLHIKRSFLLLVCCVVIRSFSFWFIIVNIQCSWTGLPALLPLIVFIITGLVDLIAANARKPQLTKIQYFVDITAYMTCSFLWATGAILAFGRSKNSTGAVCYTDGYIESHTPLIQVLMVLIDAAILIQLQMLCRRETEEGLVGASFLSKALLVAACCIFLLCLPELLYDDMIFWAFVLDYVDVRDLLTDSILLTTTLHSLFNLGALVHPTTVAVQISFLSAYFHLVRGVAITLDGKHMYVVVIAVAAAVYMFMSPRQSLTPPNSNESARLHTWIGRGYTGLALFGLLVLIAVFQLSGTPRQAELSLSQSVDHLYKTAVSDFDEWAKTATESYSLADASATYKSRYGIPPPPNFDKWYQFAEENHSPVIDTFDQIHKDLLPFWGIHPKEIRDRTTHLMEYADMGFHGFRVRNGTLETSPHIPGSHMWMANTIGDMVRPFAQWLPDMEFVINSADECRVAVPFEDMEVLQQKAKETRARIRTGKVTIHGAEPVQLPREFPKPHTTISPHFTNNIRRQLFHTWAARSCPPGSPARSYRWWDKSTICIPCKLPHSTARSLLLSNMSYAHDICHQPDLAHLSGFYQTPAAVVSTRRLFPVFSQARAGGFSDILFPSPWNFAQKSFYDDSSGVEWSEKRNGLFWRGSSSDGYAARGSWTSFLRARAMHKGYQWRSSRIEAESLEVNMSFVGEIIRCHQRDCAAERDSFRLWAKPLLSNEEVSGDPLMQVVAPFEENWQYKHLLDMDGAGFSGRFLSFLKSRSLVYRAGVFRAWFDERLSAWNHYVPVDVRLGEGFWHLVGDYLGRRGRGEEQARLIAERGREWANIALRKEDMQVYMFRLLLEWGRLCNDERDSMGFVAE